MAKPELICLLIVIAGLVQLLLVAASLVIPLVLRWPEDTAKLQPITRQIFWTYTGYIWVTNLCFGILSTFAPALIVAPTGLAIVVTSYHTLYWLARLLVQVVVIDRNNAPPGRVYTVSHYTLIVLLFYLTCVYAYATYFNSAMYSGA